MAPRPKVLAHRGANRRAGENTIAAFALAAEIGADGVELDVRRTADGVLVVHHDSEHPAVGRIAGINFEELRSALPQVPTLVEALDVCESMLVNIEMKCLPWEVDPDPDRDLPRAVVELIRTRGTGASVIVSSFDLEAVNTVRALDPALYTGWLVYGQPLGESLELVAELGHRALHPDRSTVLEASADDLVVLRDTEVEVNVWTVNDPDEIRRLAELEVSAVITDEPDVALIALESST